MVKKKIIPVKEEIETENVFKKKGKIKKEMKKFPVKY